MTFGSKIVHDKPEFDKGFIRIGCGFLIAAILFFSWLHWVHPEILRVPSNSNVASWQNPTFEETLTYKRMTPEERAKVLAEGVPGADLWTVVFQDFAAVIVALLCFMHARKHWGDWMAYTFLLGSFIFTGLQESIWILWGRFTGSASCPGLGEIVAGTYWFPKGALWFFETPVFACIGWFYLAYTCVWVAGTVFPKAGLVGRAAIGGLIAMGFDLWQDPVVVSPELMLWVWAKQDVIHLWGIPQSNFAGWFFLIFVFAILWEQLPRWEAKWGRAKATGNFFLILVFCDFAILGSLAALSYLLRATLIFLGFEHTVVWPQGW